MVLMVTIYTDYKASLQPAVLGFWLLPFEVAFPLLVLPLWYAMQTGAYQHAGAERRGGPVGNREIDEALGLVTTQARAAAKANEASAGGATIPAPEVIPPTRPMPPAPDGLLSMMPDIPVSLFKNDQYGIETVVWYKPSKVEHRRNGHPTEVPQEVQKPPEKPKAN